MTRYEALTTLINRAQHVRTCQVTFPQTNAAAAFGSTAKACTCDLSKAVRVVERMAAELISDIEEN